MFERYVILYRYKTASTIVLRSPPFERYVILYRYKTLYFKETKAPKFERYAILYRYKQHFTSRKQKHQSLRGMQFCIGTRLTNYIQVSHMCLRDV